MSAYFGRTNWCDIVFSNSVGDHVGDWGDQKAFAHQTSCVGKGYWIQTPNKNFPIEPHWYFPLFQFLPLSVHEEIAVFWPFSFPRRYGHRMAEDLKDMVRNIRPLKVEEMRSLFPDGDLWEERLFGFIKSIVVYRC